MSVSEVTVYQSTAMFRFPAEISIFLLALQVETDSGVHQPPNQLVQYGLSQGIKLMEHEVDCSPLNGAQFKEYVELRLICIQFHGLAFGRMKRKIANKRKFSIFPYRYMNLSSQLELFFGLQREERALHTLIFANFPHGSSIYNGNITPNISRMKEAMAHTMKPCFT